MSKSIVRYTFLMIPSKLQAELSVTFDSVRQPEYASQYENGDSVNIRLFPIVILTISRKAELDENGNRVRAPFNPNDSISATKFNVPILINELKAIEKDMSIQELYTYHGDRLELNDEIAEKVRRVFVLGFSTIELVPVVITQEDDNKVEGIKMKFNNEQSTVLLTLNELTALIYSLESLSIDTLAMQLYTTYLKDKTTKYPTRLISDKPVVDIQPKKSTFTEFQ